MPTEYTFPQALAFLQSEGFIITLRQYDSNAWGASAGPFGWRAVARELARLIPHGVFQPTGKDAGTGVRWGMGPRTEAIILEHDMMKTVQKGRSIARGVMGLKLADVLPWSVGGLCRVMLLWAAKPDKPRKFSETLRYQVLGVPDEPKLQYHDCSPGHYPDVTLWDCSGFYYHMLRRLPGPRVKLRHNNTVDWKEGQLSADERTRWGEVLDSLGDEKFLRNCLWGVCMGSTRRTFAYTSAPGKKGHPAGRVRVISFKFRPGPFRNAAILMARSGAELCSLASQEVGSVYSTVDSVCAPGGVRPSVWDLHGFPYKVDSAGPGHIIGLRYWAIGGNHTIPYCPEVPFRHMPLPPGYECKTKPRPVERHRFSEFWYSLWL